MFSLARKKLSLAIAAMAVPTLAMGAQAPALSSATASTSATATTTCGAQAKFAPTCGALWGIYTLNGGNPATAVTNLESKLGRRFTLTSRFHDFSNHPTLGQFPDASERLLGTSRTLFMSWQARVGAINKNIRWADIANGKYDSYVYAATTRLKDWGRPVVISFDAEFDNLTSLKGSVADYVRAYRHIVDIFRARKVTNVAWAWVSTGYLGAGNAARIAAGYPGDAYVDWVGYDPYNFYRCLGTSWKTFEQTISPAYNWLAAQGWGDKPVIISEYGTQYDAADPARSKRFYSDIPSVLKRYPNVKGLIRFDADGVVNSGRHCNLWLDNGPGMLSAFGSASKTSYLGYGG